MESLLSIGLGLALSAACGFRVFVPLLVLGVAGAAGRLSLAPSFDWLASPPALLTLGLATVLEVGAYYVPWLDNLLDTLAAPAAVVAGIVVTASLATDMDPLLQWTLAVVAGGGLAGTVQASTTVMRAGSSALSGGLGNPLVATGELAGAVGLSVAALLVPVAALLTLLLTLVLALLWLRRRNRTRARGLESPA